MSDTNAELSRCLSRVAANGDREAFRLLFNRFSPLIKAFAYKLSTSELTENLAEELVQETMIKVWQKAASFDPNKASPGTWIFTIARNTRVDILRKNARHQVNRISGNQGDDGFDVEDIWIENEDDDAFNQLAKQRNSEMIHESMKSLPEEQSSILEKVYLEDKSHSEIATELSLPLGTVKSRVRLALNKLRLSIDR